MTTCTEWLDVVDREDRVIGAATRSEVHARQLMHRSCHMLVIRDDGRLVVQRRSAEKDNNPGLWDTSAAGHVDRGEAYADAACRELAEEIGIRAAPDDLVLRFRLPPVSWTGFEHVAVYTLRSDASLVVDAREIAETRELGAPELRSWIRREPASFTRIFREIWKRCESVVP